MHSEGSGPGRSEPDSSARIKAHDAARWLDEHGDALYDYARAHVGRRDLAEDLVQETFLAALRAQAQFRGGSTVRTWLLAILRRKVADVHRRQSEARARAEAAAAMAGGRDPVLARHFADDGDWRRRPQAWPPGPESAEGRELREALDRCMDRLPTTLAAAISLREREGLEIDAVAQELAITAGNVRVRLHRARLLLRDCLEARGHGDGARADSVGEGPPE